MIEDVEECKDCIAFRIMQNCKYKKDGFCSNPNNEFDGLCSCESCNLSVVKRCFEKCYKAYEHKLNNFECDYDCLNCEYYESEPEYERCNLNIAKGLKIGKCKNSN